MAVGISLAEDENSKDISIIKSEVLTNSLITGNTFWV
jgi:hypothetical protein